MMQTKIFTLTNNLSQLHDELIVNIPTFLRTHKNSEGNDELSDDGGRVFGQGDVLTIMYADDIDTSVITAVVEAHVPKDN